MNITYVDQKIWYIKMYNMFHFHNAGASKVGENLSLANIVIRKINVSG